MSTTEQQRFKSHAVRREDADKSLKLALKDAWKKKNGLEKKKERLIKEQIREEARRKKEQRARKRKVEKGMEKRVTRTKSKKEPLPPTQPPFAIATVGYAVACSSQKGKQVANQVEAVPNFSFYRFEEVTLNQFGGAEPQGTLKVGTQMTRDQLQKKVEWDKMKTFDYKRLRTKNPSQIILSFSESDTKDWRQEQQVISPHQEEI